jgi:hypothetical protein
VSLSGEGDPDRTPDWEIVPPPEPCEEPPASGGCAACRFGIPASPDLPVAAALLLLGLLALRRAGGGTS